MFLFLLLVFVCFVCFASFSFVCFGGNGLLLFVSFGFFSVMFCCVLCFFLAEKFVGFLFFLLMVGRLGWSWVGRGLCWLVGISVVRCFVEASREWLPPCSATGFSS